jgi:hypothetical protein
MAGKSLAGILAGSMNRLCVGGLRWEFTSASLPAEARRRSDGHCPSGTDCSDTGGACTDGVELHGAELDGAHPDGVHLDGWERTMA